MKLKKKTSDILALENKLTQKEDLYFQRFFLLSSTKSFSL